MVTLAHADVPVVVGLTDNSLRLSSNGEDIGEWSTGEFTIDALADGTFAISAESETLLFIPSEPETFASSIDGDHDNPSTAPQSPPGRHEPRSVANQSVTQAEDATVTVDTEVATNGVETPRTATMLAFYALAAATGALGLWALVRMIF